MTNYTWTEIRYKPTCEIVKKYSNGREIIFLGDAPSCRNILKCEYGISNSIIATAKSENLMLGDNFVHVDLLKNRSDDFYVVAPTLAYNDSLRLKLIEYGYEEFKDFVFSHHEKKVISFEEGEYHDEYGNNLYFSNKKGSVVLDPIAGNNEMQAASEAYIIFTGSGSNVTIGENVTWRRSNQPVTINCESSFALSNKVYFQPSYFLILDGINFFVGERTKIDDTVVLINEFSKLLIGDDCSILNDRLRTGPNRLVRIGNDVMFSWDVTVLGHDGHMIYDLETSKCINNTVGECVESITIEDHVWLGGESVVLPNTKIGKGSIIAYRGMAKGEYPNNVIIAGSPAKVIKKNIAWGREKFCFDEKSLFNLKEEYRQKTFE